MHIGTDILEGFQILPNHQDRFDYTQNRNNPMLISFAPEAQGGCYDFDVSLFHSDRSDFTGLATATLIA